MTKTKHQQTSASASTAPPEDIEARAAKPRTLIAYVIGDHHVHIRPAKVEREWMESATQWHPYRCLPLNIANTYGWEILCTSGFEAIWNGQPSIDAISIAPDDITMSPAISHFGHGVLTFRVSCLFRTDPGIDLVVQGPINRPKDAIAPLTGLIETDWSPYSFTMNWLFTRAGARVRFEREEPFCHIFPVRRGDLENIEPEFRPLAENPELERQHKMWRANREHYNRLPASEALLVKWDQHYYRGLDPEGRRGVVGHRTRSRSRPFAK